MGNTLTAVATVAWNVGVPVIAVSAGAKAVGGFSETTAVSVVAGNALFGLITWWGPGERSHRYFGGTVAQILPLFLGNAISVPGNSYHEFEPGRFFVAMTVSLVVQIFLKELPHIPEALKKQNSDHGGLSSQNMPDTSEGGSETNALSDTIPGSSSSSAIVSFGVSGNNSTLSTFVPAMEGLQVAPPGSMITEVRERRYEKKDLFQGNTIVEEKEYKTAEGGNLRQRRKIWSGWLGSEKEEKRQYTAGSGGFGNIANTEESNSGPIIEEVDSEE